MTGRTGAVVAVVVALGAAAPEARAVGACEKTGAVLSVTQNGHEDRIGLRVDAGTIVVTSSSASPHTCTGGTPTVATIDSIVVSDNSDDPALPAADDGSIRITVDNPSAFSSGGDPIEMILNFKQGGNDRFLLLGSTGPDSILLGDDGVDPNGAATAGGRITLAPPDEIDIQGLTGDDLVSAQGGGSAGDPYDDAGALELSGGGGDDTVRGSSRTSNADTLSGGSNDDTLEGFAGSDTLTGDLGDDTLTGGPGADTADFTSFSTPIAVDLATTGPQDTLAGSDTFTGVERARGGTGNDRLAGDGADNSLFGDSGDDVLIGRGGEDVYSGGAGIDTADFAGEGAPIDADLRPGGIVLVGALPETISQIEGVIGSRFADRLLGGDEANSLTGGPGSDTIDGAAGADTVFVRDGERDSVACGDGTDSVQADRLSLDTLAACEIVDALPEPAPPILPGLPAPPGGGATQPTNSPSLRDTALDFRLTGASTQRLLRQRAIVVRAQCRFEACTTVASAAGTLPKVRRIGLRRVTIGRRTARNPGGAARTLRLPLSARQRTAIRRALAAGKRVRVRATVVATDAAGNRVTRSLLVTARR